MRYVIPFLLLLGACAQKSHYINSDPLKEMLVKPGCVCVDVVCQ